MSERAGKFAPAKIKDLAKIIVSNVDKVTNDDESPVQICNYMDVYQNERISSSIPFMRGSASKDEIKKFSLKKHDVLITKDSESPDDIGVSAVVTEEVPDLVCGYHLAIIRPDSKQAHGPFIAKALRTNEVKSYFLRFANGSTRFGLTLPSIQETKLLIPDLPTQEKIADILGKLDEVIELTKLEIAKFSDLKSAIAKDLLDKFSLKKSKKAKISEVAIKVTDGEHATPPRTTNGVYLLSARNIRSSFISVEDVDYISRETYEKLSKRIRIQENDLLISCSGTIGRVSLVPANFECCLVRSVAVVRFDTSIIFPQFALELFQMDEVQNQIKKELNQLAQANLFQGSINKIKIPILDLSDQVKISSILERASKQISNKSKKLNSLNNLKLGLMNDLLSGRLKVKV